MTEHHVRQLRRLALVIATAMPAVLAAFAIGATINQADIVESARGSAVCLMFVLAGVIFAPLFLDHSPAVKQRGFVVFWFSVAAFFNVVWQIPLILFRSSITTAEHTYENLQKFIGWWGYGFADSHYEKVTPWMMSEELWWLLAVAISLVGLVVLRRGREPLAFLLLGLAGALQAYNATLYIVENWLVDGFSNIPDNSGLALMLYWGFNLLWPAAAGLASFYSFRFVLERAEGNTRTGSIEHASA